MEAVYFTALAALLYVVADRGLDFMERRAGRRFENRTVIFFLLLLGMALGSFALIRWYTGLP
jgi:cytochrome c biogenesis factor